LKLQGYLKAAAVEMHTMNQSFDLNQVAGLPGEVGIEIFLETFDDVSEIDDLARTLKIPFDFRGAAQVIADGYIHLVAYGADFRYPHGPVGHN